LEKNYVAVLQLLNKVTTPSVKKFGDRLKLQKITYLARELGYETGFSFSWYIRGPYSPSLTTFLFAADSQGFLTAPPEPDETNRKVLLRTISLLEELLGGDTQDLKKLELYASAWYSLPFGSVTEERKGTLARTLNQLKPDFAVAEYVGAIDSIQRFRTEHRELR
jgi:hypothetical protein